MPTHGVLKGRNPLRPDGTEWVAFAAEGPRGPIGPSGPDGPVGPPGAVGVHPGTAEVWVSNNMPDPAVNPEVELWYDLDDTPPRFLSEIPRGGATGAPYTMVSDTHGDADWGPLLLPTTSPGTVDTITTRNLTVATLDPTTWEGDTRFDDNVSAEVVTDPSAGQYLAWEQLDVDSMLLGNFISDFTIGPCKAWRNRYQVLVNLCVRSNPEIVQEVWLDVAQLPAGWVPPFEMWHAQPSVDGVSDSVTTENRITASGMCQMRGKAFNSPDPQINTAFCFYYAFPRAG